MSRDCLEYNGIKLAVTFTEVYEREIDYDRSGTDYYHTRVRLRVRAVYNPEATSYRRNANGEPVLSSGEFAPVTEVAIRAKLEEPRRQLIYTEGSTELVRSPRDDKPLDADNGPHPIKISLKKMHGERSWEVVFEIQTAIDEYHVFNRDSHEGEDRVLISNRWSTYHHLEGGAGRFQETIKREGIAKFNPSKILEEGYFADDFRKWLFPEPEKGFVRQSLDIDVSEDGSVLHYTVIDQKIRLHLRKSGITKVECLHSHYVKVPEALTQAVSFASTVGNYALNAGQVITSLGTQGSFTGLNPIPAIQNAIQTTVPVKMITIWARIFGEESASLSTLQTWLSRIIQYRLAQERLQPNILQVPNNGFHLEMEETHDVENGILTGKIVLLSGLGDQTNQILNMFQDNGSFKVPAHDHIHDDVAKWVTASAVPNASMPKNSNGTRGSVFRGVAMAQLLHRAFEKPYKPALANPETLTQDPQQ